MTKYVEDYGKTSSCSVVTMVGCSDKEKVFIEKMKDKETAEIVTQLSRLEGMAGKSMKPDLKAWLNQRTKILEKLAPPKDEL